jgi:DNA-binding transcriptional regulator YhcF (GntR family)
VQTSSCDSPFRFVAGVGKRPRTGSYSWCPGAKTPGPRLRPSACAVECDASQLGHDFVGTEHILLGLLRDPDSGGTALLLDLGVTPGAVRARLKNLVRRGGGRVKRAELPYTASAKRVLEHAMAEARELEHSYIDTQHLMIGSVRQLADQLDIAPGTVARAYGELERIGVVVTEGARGTRIAEPSSSSRARPVDLDNIAGLLRPAAVAAFHMGADADDMRRALEAAMKGIFSPTS